MQLLAHAIVILALCLCALAARAEPYFAIHQGVKCNACHVNPTGGGKRTEFGNAFGHSTFPTRKLSDVWLGEVNDWIAIGGDLRANFDAVSIPNNQDTNEFRVEELLAYVELRLVPDRLSVYVDEQLAPGGASNREVYGLLWSKKKDYYVKAGKMFLPYGLRLEDDSAFIRQVPGINYTTPDNGVEGGYEQGPYTVNLAVTNGSAGGSENNQGKQYSLLASYTLPEWRIGASFNFNELDGGDRQMQNIFGGLKTGSIAWLVEVDYVSDDGSPNGSIDQLLGLVEANAIVRPGHNLKLTYEYFDPDRDIDEDERTRWSLVWEYFPIAYTQISLGYRQNDGIPQNDLQNTQEFFLQLHNHF